MKIAYYISNHGFGHATRSAALILELSKVGVYTFINTDRPAFIFDNIPNKYKKIRETKLDFGVYQKDLFTPDLLKTKKDLLELWDIKENIIKQEVGFFKDEKIDFIVSDITLFAFEIGKRLKIPVYAVSNFDWYFVYNGLYGNDTDIKPILAEMLKMQKYCDLAIRLPFSSPDSMNFPKVQTANILAQFKSHSIQEMIKELSLDANKINVLMGFGGEGDNPIKDCTIPENVNLICRYNIPGATLIPKEYDYPKLIASVDVVITKVGYSTLAESVQYNKFLVTTSRTNYPEDDILLDGLKEYQNHLYIAPDEMSKLSLSEIINKIKISPVQSNFKNVNSSISQMIISHFIQQKVRITNSEQQLYQIIVVGTNNVQQLVASVCHQKVSYLHESTEITGLGIDMKNGLISRSAFDRTQQVLSNYLGCFINCVNDAIIIGTSCSREAKNIDKLTNWLKEKYDLEYNIISEIEEAELNGYANMIFCRGINYITAFDLGGGSTEFSQIQPGKITNSFSLDFGILKLYNRFGDEYQQVISYVKGRLSELNGQISIDTFIGIGGTITSILIVRDNKDYYDPNEVNGAILTIHDITNVLNLILKVDDNKYNSIVAFEPIERKIFLTGLYIVKTIVEYFEIDSITVSSLSVQHGYLMKYLKG